MAAGDDFVFAVAHLPNTNWIEQADIGDAVREGRQRIIATVTCIWPVADAFYREGGEHRHGSALPIPCAIIIARPTGRDTCRERQIACNTTSAVMLPIEAKV